MGASRLRVGLLGRSVVEVDDAAPIATWPRPSARRLVTLLVLAPDRRRTREELAELLFPHLTPDRSSRSVSKALSMARSVLPDGWLEADRTNVWMSPDVAIACDLHDHVLQLHAALGHDGPARAEALAAALGATGTPLVDDPYEDWAIEVVEDLERLRQRARVELARTTGSPQAWAAVAEHDPASEDACAALAAARASAGDRDGIARAFDRCRRGLAELGLEPTARLSAHIRRLLDATPIRPATLRTAEPPCWGREAELEVVLAALEATDGARGSVAVTGPAGIGKSRLLTVVAGRLVEGGWRVGSGTAVPDDRLAPMAALRTALSSILDEQADPLARRMSPADPGTARAPAADDLARLADEVDAALRSAGRVALVIDDVQWCDPALQRVLVRLAARTDRTWALLLGGRTDEPGAPLPPVGTTVTSVKLGPVDDATAGRIVTAELPDAPADTLRRLVERGGGNPFFLAELARHHARRVGEPGPDVPDRVVALLELRLDAVSNRARSLLEHLAILGEDADYAVLDALGDGVAGDGAQVDELIANHLAREVPDGLRLVHPLLRDAVLAGTNALRRGALHRMVADAIEDREPGDVDRWQLVAAGHRVSAYRDGGRLREAAEPAARAGFRAGRLAAQLSANETAEELYVGALEAFEALGAAERGALAADASNAWIELGHLRVQGRGHDVAEDAYRTALGLAVDDLQRARCWRALSYLPYRAGDLAGSAEVCERGLAALGTASPLAAALLQVELGWILHRIGRLDEAVEVLAEAADVCEEAGEWGLAARALDRLGMALDGVDRLDEALDRLERASRACDRTASKRMRAVIEIHTAALLRRAGRLDEATERVERGARIADELADRYTRSVAHWIAGDILEADGDTEGALAERDAEIALLGSMDNHFNLAGAHARRARLLGALGRREESDEAAAVARAAATRSGLAARVDEVERLLVGA